MPCHVEQANADAAGKLVTAATEQSVLQSVLGDRVTDHGNADQRPDMNNLWNMIRS